MKQLPVIAALNHALRSTWKNLPFAIHVSWPWMAILLPFQIAAALYVRDNFAGFDPEKPDPAMAAGLASVEIPLLLLQFLATSSIAVSWHRYILTDAVPHGWQRLAVDGKVLRYMGNVVLLSLILVGILFVPALSIGVLNALIGGAAVGLFIPLALAAAVIYTRFSVKFPAVALERKDFGFADAWRVTANNSLPILGLFFLMVLCALVVAFAIIVITSPLSWLQSDVALAAALAVQLAVGWVMTIFTVTILTSLYGYFVENRSF
jgi:hypothetical protein